MRSLCKLYYKLLGVAFWWHFCQVAILLCGKQTFTYFGFIYYTVYFYFALGIEVLRLIQSGFLAINLVDLGQVFLTIPDTLSVCDEVPGSA